MSIPLSDKQKRYLRGLAHPLKPVIMVGNKGLTDAVLAELSLALDHHELVKVHIAAADREARDKMIDEMVQRCDAQLVQRIGNIAGLYRGNEKAPQISLPR